MCILYQSSFFCLAYGEMGRILKVKSKSIVKMLFPMMGLDHHSCPPLSLMILRCVPIWKQRESGRGYSSPEESNQAGQYSREGGGSGGKTMVIQEGEIKRQLVEGGIAVGRIGFSPC